jgi:3-deoxy-D-manno-octulosonic acid (KDO) 8-phosphate synthase
MSLNNQIIHHRKKNHCSLQTFEQPGVTNSKKKQTKIIQKKNTNIFTYMHPEHQTKLKIKPIKSSEVLNITYFPFCRQKDLWYLLYFSVHFHTIHYSVELLLPKQETKIIHQYNE